jgi:hypothetical protein
MDDNLDLQIKLNNIDVIKRMNTIEGMLYLMYDYVSEINSALIEEEDAYGDSFNAIDDKLVSGAISRIKHDMETLERYL